MPRARTQLGKAIWALTASAFAVDSSDKPATIM